MPKTVGILLVAAAQQATLTGVVRDSVDLEPVAFAQVSVATVDGEALQRWGASDRFGTFVVPGVATAGPERVDVRAFGYCGVDPHVRRAALGPGTRAPESCADRT